MKISLLAILLLQVLTGIVISAPSEKKPLTHDDYDGWNFLSRQQISPDGNWISWEVNPQSGDGWLHYLDRRTGTVDSVARGTRVSFSPGSEYMAFRIRPQAAEIRRVKAENKRGSQMPRDSIAIYMLESGIRMYIPRVRSFAIAREDSPWIAIHLHAPAGRNNSDGSRLILFNPVTVEQHEFSNVVEYTLSGNGRIAAFIRKGQTAFVNDSNDTIKVDQATVQVFDTEERSAIKLLDSPGTAKTIRVHEKGGQAAFLFSAARVPGRKPSTPSQDPGLHNLWHWQEESTAARPIITPETRGMPDGWNVSEHSFIRFAEKEDRFFFGTAEIPVPEPEDTLLTDERFTVDIWHYQDPRLQPQQLNELNRDQERTYTAVYHIEKEEMVQLADRRMPYITTTQRGSGDLEVGTSPVPYQIQSSFEQGNFRDVYLVNINTGKRRLVLEKYRGPSLASSGRSAGISPGGKYFLYYSQLDSNWHSIPVDSNPARANLTDNIEQPMYHELHDQPSSPGIYGIAGWTEGDGHVLLYDRYDIWKVDPEGNQKPVSLTNGYGRKNCIQFQYVNLEGNDIIADDELLLSAFNDINKQSGFYAVSIQEPGNPVRLVMEDANFYTPKKAGGSDLLLWRKSTFAEFPDLWTSDMQFANRKKISSANPQKAGFKWGTAQLVDWKSFTGDSLQGILYTPDDPEPGRKYPMIVYFYERSSHNLHRWHNPAPSRSTINIPYAVSNDYVIFVPDIPYQTGYPGLSAYNSIVSGTKAMLHRFDHIDPDNLGLQGQSWGGYQITWLITRTDMFRAAMAGAPVSNMTSAYGGIRWSSGISRIFQYEQTQSRIGRSLWEEPDLYMENSPVFFADRVNTPLLMMHNDDDGSVPWYQGIEYFMALRRLGKPVWMLNYNGESHNLTRRPNMMDLSKRMGQFFDHYLKGKPAPVWMVYGIPATRKGRTHGYDLVN